MRQSRFSGRRCFPAFAAIGAVLGLLLLAGACKSPIMPEDGEADIVIINDYGETLNIYMNGEFLYPVEHNTSVEIDNVKYGIYYFEARTVDTDELVYSDEVDVEVRSDYTFTIDDIPDINVINDFGTPLAIYMNGEYMFDLEDEENRWIIDLAFGEYFLHAIRKEDGMQIASITFDIDDYTDHTWTLE
jgi:hypothetical protein